jgi:hypothetical protein
VGSAPLCCDSLRLAARPRLDGVYRLHSLRPPPGDTCALECIGGIQYGCRQATHACLHAQARGGRGGLRRRPALVVCRQVHSSPPTAAARRAAGSLLGRCGSGPGPRCAAVVRPPPLSRDAGSRCTPAARPRLAAVRRRGRCGLAASATARSCSVRVSGGGVARTWRSGVMHRRAHRRARPPAHASALARSGDAWEAGPAGRVQTIACHGHRQERLESHASSHPRLGPAGAGAACGHRPARHTFPSACQ